MNDQNNYDGCGIVSSRLMKKNFEGFNQEVIINSLKGTIVPFDMKKYLNESEDRLWSEDNYHYIKQGLREGVVGVYELGWKTSCDFYDLAVTTKEEIIEGLKEKYNFDKDKALVFINENIK